MMTYRHTEIVLLPKTDGQTCLPAAGVETNQSPCGEGTDGTNRHAKRANIIPKRPARSIFPIVNQTTKISRTPGYYIQLSRPPLLQTWTWLAGIFFLSARKSLSYFIRFLWVFLLGGGDLFIGLKTYEGCVLLP